MSKAADKPETFDGRAVDSVTCDRDVAKVAILGVPDVPGIAARLFSRLAERDIKVGMIIQSIMRGGVNDIAFLVRRDILGKAIEACREVAKEIGSQGVTFDAEIGRVTVTGPGVSERPEVPYQVFSTLAQEGINIDMISSTHESITCVVESSDVERAVQALRRCFLS
jgi:aspartate kinase